MMRTKNKKNNGAWSFIVFFALFAVFAAYFSFPQTMRADNDAACSVPSKQDLNNSLIPGFKYTILDDKRVKYENSRPYCGMGSREELIDTAQRSVPTAYGCPLDPVIEDVVYSDIRSACSFIATFGEADEAACEGIEEACDVLEEATRKSVEDAQETADLILSTTEDSAENKEICPGGAETCEEAPAEEAACEGDGDVCAGEDYGIDSETEDAGEDSAGKESDDDFDVSGIPDPEEIEEESEPAIGIPSGGFSGEDSKEEEEEKKSWGGAVVSFFAKLFGFQRAIIDDKIHDEADCEYAEKRIKELEREWNDLLYTSKPRDYDVESAKQKILDEFIELDRTLDEACPDDEVYNSFLAGEAYGFDGNDIPDPDSLLEEDTPSVAIQDNEEGEKPSVFIKFDPESLEAEIVEGDEWRAADGGLVRPPFEAGLEPEPILAEPEPIWGGSIWAESISTIGIDDKQLEDFARWYRKLELDLSKKQKEREEKDSQKDISGDNNEDTKGNGIIRTVIRFFASFFE